MAARSWLAASVLASLLLSGCAGAGKDNHDSDSHGAHSENYEITASYDIMPQLISVYTDNTQAAYGDVGALKEILKEMKCYCGCMEDNDHDSLLRCFVADEREEGIQWSDHGALCGICLSELQDVKRLHGEGKTVEEIRSFIDKKYHGST
ncbi:hypothetical protein E6C60_2747 [Paenibacillus algicola]|uniref:Lipoprotein n=1 Tax=Paenibacillus algicola TaxID=2565926 RepID=A0A4P8XS83_9BACL|nr:PCYCGC motif-containing (lipo)protein [Paenibacillus algicola]QCT03459.1 hypothetical protein E6C60_2747 [Paenibacillus algicola]